MEKCFWHDVHRVDWHVSVYLNYQILRVKALLQNYEKAALTSDRDMYDVKN